MNAKEVFELLATHATTRLQPAGRGAATAATLRQIGDVAADLPLDIADVRTGFDALAQAIDADPPPIAARRRTCAELALIAEAFDTSGGSRAALATVFDRVASHFEDSGDPRHVSMCDTANREAAELRGSRVSS
jgi:hypothetical protein